MNTELFQQEKLPELLNLAVALGASSSSAEINRCLSDLGQLLGFKVSIAVLGSRNDEGHLMDVTFSIRAPKDWRRAYLKGRRFESDPLLTALLNAPGTGQPQTWDQLLSEGLELAPSAEERMAMGEMVQEMLQFPDLRQGAALSLARFEGAKTLLWGISGAAFEMEQSNLAGMSFVAPYLFEALESKQRRRFKSLLSERQQEILNLSQRGLSIRQVAEMTGFSERSVHNHLATIYDRLDVFNKTHAVARARSLGLIPPL